MEAEVLRCTEANRRAVTRVARGVQALGSLRRGLERPQEEASGNQDPGVARGHGQRATRGAGRSSRSGRDGAEAQRASEQADGGDHTDGGDADTFLSVEQGAEGEKDEGGGAYVLRLEVELRSIADELLWHLGWLRVAAANPEAGAAELRRQQAQEQHATEQRQRKPLPLSPHAILQAAESTGAAPPAAGYEAVATPRDGETWRGAPPPPHAEDDATRTRRQPEGERERTAREKPEHAVAHVSDSNRKLRPRRGRTRASLEHEQQQQQQQPGEQGKRRSSRAQRRRGSKAEPSPSQSRLQQLLQLTERNTGAAVAVSESLRKARAQQQQQQPHEVDPEAHFQSRLKDAATAADTATDETEFGTQGQGRIGEQGPDRPQQVARRFAATPPWMRESVLTSTDQSKVKPFICLICQRGFGRGDLLTAHMQAHRDPAAFRCISPDCGATFATYGELQAHMQQPHDKDTSTQAKAPPSTTTKAASMPAAATRRSTRRSGLIASTHCNCGLTKHASKHDKCCVDDECPCVLKGVLCVACGCRNCHNKVVRRKPGHAKAPKRS